MAVEATELAKRLRGLPRVIEVGVTGRTALTPQKVNRMFKLLAEAVEKHIRHDSWCPVLTEEHGLCGCGYEDWLRRVAEATEGGEGHER